MESEKSPSGVRARPAATTTDSSIYNEDFPMPRRMSQHIRGSIELRRSSRSSISSSEVRRSNSVSCVSRLASEDDCAKQRFIVWAAVKRNRSVRMAASDRLRCPLLRCGESFDDHETMLRHLHGCRHLTAGEYLCYECMRVEKFNDGKCKCCLGHQTKRRRIINAAKKVFSTLGHKSRKDGTAELTQVDFAIPPPPSYESLNIEEEVQLPMQSEISGNPICEMDASSAFPMELGSVNYEARFDMPLPSEEPNAILPVVSPFLVPPPRRDLRALQQNDGRRPSLTVDTINTGRPSKVPRTNYLSPSSSLRSANSSFGIISPMSAGSAGWTGASTLDTTLASPITPFSSDVESSSLSSSISRENSCKFPKDFPLPSFCSNWNNESGRSNTTNNFDLCRPGDDFTLGNLPELPGDIPLGMGLEKDWARDPLLFSFGPKENYSWSSTVDTEVNVVFTENDANPDNGAETFSSDTKTLITDTWHTLEQHMSYSLPNIRAMDNNLARRLRGLSAKDITLKGLAALKSILSNVDPAEPLDYLCFIHVIYAFTIVIHEEEATLHMNRLFKQALAYRNFVSASDCSEYAAIVTAIWEPINSEEAKSVLGRSSNVKGKGPELRANSSIPFSLDPLVEVAQNFLDDLENTMSTGVNSSQSLDVMTSELYSTHVAETGPRMEPIPDAFRITVNYVVQMLSQHFGPLSSSLAPRLRSIGQKVSTGLITSVRRMELELLQTGKAVLNSPELFDEYIPEVRRLCDPLYDQQSSNTRTQYHRLATALAETLIRNIDSPNNLLPNIDPSTAIEENVLDYTFQGDPLADFLQNFDKDFDGTDFVVDDFLQPSLEDSNNAMVHSVGQTSGSSEARDKPTHSNPNDTPKDAPGREVGAESNISHDIPSVAEEEYMPQPAKSRILPTLSISNSEDTEHTPAAAEAGPSEQKAEADDCCEICGYRPKGDPQWFKGSMAKHKKLQHSTEPPKIYRCSFPGCTSAYKNRPDNLRQHQIEKNHFVEGEGKGKQKRPGKRKKMDDE